MKALFTFWVAHDYVDPHIHSVPCLHCPEQCITSKWQDKLYRPAQAGGEVVLLLYNSNTAL